MPLTLNPTITRKLLIILVVVGFGVFVYLFNAHPAKAARASVEAFTGTGNPIANLPITQIGGSPSGMGGTIGATGYYYTPDVPDINNVELQAPATFDLGTRPLDFVRWEGDCDSFGTRSCIFSASGVVTKVVRVIYVFAPAAAVRVESRVNGTLTSGASITQSAGSPGGMNGSTTYTRYSRTDIAISLVAPASFGGGTFSDWSGCDSWVLATRTCNVSVSVGLSKTISANYIIVLATLNVQSMVSGVLTAGASIARISGTAGMNGTTQYSRTFSGDIAVVLNDTTATLGVGAFVNWTGCDSTSGTQCTVSVIAGSAKTITANYAPSTLIVESRVNGTLTSGAVITRISGTANMNGTTGSPSPPVGQYIRTAATISVTLNDTTPILGLGGFSSWSNCTSTSGTQCTISVSAGATRTVSANYSYSTLNVDSRVNGTMTSGAVITQTGGTPSPPTMGGTTGSPSPPVGRYIRTSTVAISSVVLVAPATLGGVSFSSWTCSGGSWDFAARSCTTSVALGSSRTITANYTPTTTLNVESRLSGVLTSGAVITQTGGTPSPPTMGGTTVAPGQYTRTSAAAMTNVTLVAPLSLGIGGFNSWTGCTSWVLATRSCTISVSAGATRTVSANYTLPDLGIDSSYYYSPANPSTTTPITFHASHIINGPIGVSGNIITNPAVRVDYNGVVGYDITLNTTPNTAPMAPTNNSASGTIYGSFDSNPWTPPTNGTFYYQICADDPNGDTAPLGLIYSGASGGAQIEADNSEPSNCTPRTAFTVLDPPWIQTENGNVGSACCTGAGESIQLTSPSASYLNSTYSAVGKSYFSSVAKPFRSFKNWLISDYGSKPLVGQGDFTNLISDFGQNAQTMTPPTLPNSPGIYRYNSGFTATGVAPSVSCSSALKESVVMFIDGNFTIDNVTFNPSNCPTTIVVSGNVTVNSNVTTINGFIIAYGSFTTFTNGGIDNLLTINGGVAGALTNGSILLNRNRGPAQNATLPSERFVFRANYLWVLTRNLGVSNTHILEEAP